MSKKNVYLVGIPQSGHCLVGGSRDCFAKYINAEKKLAEDQKQKIDFTRIFTVELQDEDSKYHMICGIIYGIGLPDVKSVTEFNAMPDMVTSLAKRFLEERDYYYNNHHAPGF